MHRILIHLIRIYQYLFSHMNPPACRFVPSCSSYFAEALNKHGAIKGSWLGTKRLLRCNPWNPGGYDPVP